MFLSNHLAVTEQGALPVVLFRISCRNMASRHAPPEIVDVDIVGADHLIQVVPGFDHVVVQDGYLVLADDVDVVLMQSRTRL